MDYVTFVEVKHYNNLKLMIRFRSTRDKISRLSNFLCYFESEMGSEVGLLANILWVSSTIVIQLGLSSGSKFHVRCIKL